MTTLALAEDRLEGCAQRLSDGMSLRAWLGGRWAILFSHPDDFLQEELEIDRWISILSRSFRARDVAPVELLRAGRDPGESWLGRLAASDRGRAAAVSLQLRDPAVPADFSAGTLRDDIARSGPRFAMIMDSALRCRRALSYCLPAELPSPLELIGWASALRKRDRSGDGCSCEAPQRPQPFHSGRQRSASCAVAPVFRG